MVDRSSARLQELAQAHPYLWSSVIVTLVTGALWMLQQQITVSNVSLFYLVAVLVCAATAGRAPAVLSAILSFLAFKFFFVEPIFSFTIDDTSDVWRLASFVAAALIGGALTLTAQAQAALARQQAREIAVLYRVSQSISTELDFDRIAPVIVETTMQLLDCPACELLLDNSDNTSNHAIVRGNTPPGGARAETPLRSGDQTLGRLCIVLGPGQPSLDASRQRLFETLANQAALALERSRLAQTAAHAEALAESDRLKSTLLSAVSHDLRTPLAAITAGADELLAEDVHWTPTAIREFAQLIRGEAERLNTFVTNMLDLNRIEAGALRPQRGWYNLAEIVYRVLQRHAPDLEGCPLDLTVPDDLPLVPVDYIQIEQVLWNVLQNARKYAPPAAPITITAAQQDGALLLCVGDRGPGIPPAERTRVFDKFYRLPHPDQRPVPGAGIGLAICKGLVEAHGGQIVIDGRDGGGTLVTIRLPLDLVEHAGAQGA